ncbi:hypothetical protein MTR_4g050100 [Medicago truncatula]|uniref:Uncharacterized protein n=1 Tax=Medicago truncatula TaxID=3880 RepID=A0A072UJX2_MEDTR|nr:hypothetical protein MTR_4g050100 [Medicago truncatula]
MEGTKTTCYSGCGYSHAQNVPIYVLSSLVECVNEFAEELWQFKRKATLELRERIYLLLDFLRPKGTLAFIALGNTGK